MKVSVIIPIYNSEKYLRRCLDSVVNQSVRDYEIILIDAAAQTEVLIFVMNTLKETGISKLYIS